MLVPNIFGFQYFVIFVDDFSRVTHLHMKEGSKLKSVLKSFYMQIKTSLILVVVYFTPTMHVNLFITHFQFFDDHGDGIIHQ